MDESPGPNTNIHHFPHRHRQYVEAFVTLLSGFGRPLSWPVIQCFAMQAFQIPTGSMAEHSGCPLSISLHQCGFLFDFGSDSLTVHRHNAPNVIPSADKFVGR
jgi:hypothetical protein